MGRVAFGSLCFECSRTITARKDMLRAIGLLLLCVGTLARATDDAPRYAAAFDAQASSIQVRLCLAQAHAQVAFAADSSGAMRYVQDLHRAGGGAIETAAGSWIARDWRAGECLEHRADLWAIGDAH